MNKTDRLEKSGMVVMAVARTQLPFVSNGRIKQ